MVENHLTCCKKLKILVRTGHIWALGLEKGLKTR